MSSEYDDTPFFGCKSIDETTKGVTRLRGLSDTFMNDLVGGILSQLLAAVVKDRDLLLEIREDYINVYFKGHSLLKLSRQQSQYLVEVHEKFQPSEIKGLRLIQSKADTETFVKAKSAIKERIIDHGDGGNEIEYEQSLIRSNNGERRLNTEYFIIDRQIAVDAAKERLDLLAIHWPRRGRKQGQTVPLVLMEVKFGLNPDIREINQ